MIDIIFDNIDGFVLDLDDTNTGTAEGILYDTFMQHFTLEVGQSEVSYTF